MSTPCESKYSVCQMDGCDKEPCSYHPDEMYCPEHENEYKLFLEFIGQYREERKGE